jgi:hypothetical protein
MEARSVRRREYMEREYGFPAGEVDLRFVRNLEKASAMRAMFGTKSAWRTGVNSVSVLTFLRSNVFVRISPDARFICGIGPGHRT